MDKGRFHEKIKFRLIQCPDCSHQLCWVNPRLPNHCPECGEKIFLRLKFEGSSILLTDDEAQLTYHHKF